MHSATAPIENEPGILEQVRAAAHEDIVQTLRTLLEDKCLYQSSKIEWQATGKLAKIYQARYGSKPGECLFTGQIVSFSAVAFRLGQLAANYATLSWTILPELQPGSPAGVLQPNVFVWPPAKLYCRNCKSTGTHLSGSLKINTVSQVFSLGHPSAQVFNCSYQCQSCRTAPIIYQVTRRADKVTLTGCSEYPHVAVFDDAPDGIRDYLSEAKVAYSTGRILAGLFFLRTSVEQHMRLSTGITGRASGDEIASAYYKLLPANFPNGEWILGRVYEDLSEKLHAADPDAKQFDKSYSELSRYFQVLRLFPITTRAPSSAEEKPPLG